MITVNKIFDMRTVYLILIFILTGLLSPMFGQENEEEKEKFRRHTLTLFTGYALIPKAVSTESEAHEKSTLSEDNLTKKVLIVPVLGIDYDYKFSEKIAIGLQNDIELSSYYVERNDETLLQRNYAFVSALVFIYEPIPWLALFAGPGYEFEQHESFFVGKIGADFIKRFENDWGVAATLSVDIKEVNTSASFGITVLKSLGKPR